MSIECPYCGEPKLDSSLRSHVALQVGDGHGPSGQVPDDFEDPADADTDEFGASTDPLSETDDASDDADDADDGLPSGIRRMVPV